MIGYCPHCSEVKELNKCKLCANCVIELENEKIVADLEMTSYEEVYGGEK